jgi:hypothetical protein
MSLADFEQRATRFEAAQCSRCETRGVYLTCAQPAKRSLARLLRALGINNDQAK